MIAHWDIIQGTAEWHQIRNGKIGGSTAYGLFVKSDTLLNDLVAARLEPFEIDEDGGYENSAIRRGNELEPLARRELSAYTGYDFQECGWLQSEFNELLGISPDGITKDMKFMCEIKCPGRKEHLETLRGKVIPLKHLDQVVHNFTVNDDLEKVFFCSFRPECEYPLFVKSADRETMVNLGTKSKPIVKPVWQWASIAHEEANMLLKDIGEVIESLKF